MQRPFSKRGDPIRLFGRRLLTMALLTLAVFACIEVWDVYHKERDSRVLRVQAEAQLEEMRQEEAHLSAEVQNLRTLRGKEAALREQYEVGRDGEGLIIIVEPKTPEPIQASTTWEKWVTRYLPFW